MRGRAVSLLGKVHFCGAHLAHIGGRPCLLDPRHELPHRLSDSMHRRWPAVLRGIAHVDDGDEVVPIGTGENGLQQRRIEGPDPQRGEPLILRGKHQVSGDDGGIDLGAVLPVIAPHPRLGRTAPDGQEKGRIVVGTGGCFDGLQRLRVGDGPYVDGLLVDGRGGYSSGFEDAVDGFPRDGLRGEGAAGVAGVEEGGEVHGILVLVILISLALPGISFVMLSLTWLLTIVLITIKKGGAITTILCSLV